MNNTIRRLLRESLMKELSVRAISSKNFNVKEIKDHWLTSSPEQITHSFKYEMQDDYNLSDEEKENLVNADSDEIEEMPTFKKWLTYEVQYQIDNFISYIDGYINNGYIRIWREMTVDQEWLDRLPYTGKRLGNYWSYDENAAEAHWGGKGKFTIKIQSIIKEEYVDWTQTIEANIDPSLGEQEKEITLFKNTPINIEVLFINGKEVDISGIKDKIFKS